MNKNLKKFIIYMSIFSFINTFNSILNIKLKKFKYLQKKKTKQNKKKKN